MGSAFRAVQPRVRLCEEVNEVAVDDQFEFTYLSFTHQFGTASAGGANTLTDNSRQWVAHMWKDTVVTIRVGGQGGMEELPRS